MRSPWGALLDASIYFSFDKSGFRRHARGFRPGDLDVDLSAKRCLVTGANSGLGFAAAEAFAARGAEVWLLCRNPERAEQAREDLRTATGSERLQVSLLDVSDLDAVRAWEPPVGAVDVLVHNAGLLPRERALSPQGLELTFATHVAGPFLLTHRLRPTLEERGADVIWVSSGGMYPKRLDLADLDWSARAYDGVAAYAQTKRMQVVLSELFHERWPAQVRFHAMHPGWADSPGVRSSLPGFWAFTKDRLRSNAEGADTVVWLGARGREQKGGQFWFDRMPRSPHLLPGTRASTATRAELWETCARVTSIDA